VNNKRPLGGLDLNLLLAFDALMAERSVSRASRRLGLSQPAFSNALGRLRQAVGDPLFTRTGGGMRPTPRAVEMAVPIHAALDELNRAISGPRAETPPHRVVRLIANEYAQCLLLPLLVKPLLVRPRLVKSLSRRAPEVALDVRQASTPLASAFEADLTIAWEGQRNTHASSVVLLRDDLVAVAKASNRAATRLVASLTSYENFQLVDGAEAAIFALRPFGSKPHLMSNAMAAMCLAAGSDGIAIVPRGLARRFARPLGLTTMKLPHSLPSRALVISSASDAMPSDDAALAVVWRSLVDAGRLLGRSRRA